MGIRPPFFASNRRSIRVNSAASCLGPGMTLATVLSLCIAYFASALLLAQSPALARQISQNQTSQNQVGAPQQSGTAGAAPTQTPPASQAQAPSPTPTPPGEQNPATSKRRSREKKVAASAPVECPPANPASGRPSPDAASTATSPNAPPANATPSTQAPSNPSPANQPPANNAPPNTAPSKNASPVNCPPLKTVVHDGGTTEPAIQLVGGKSDQASQQRSTTDALLGSTEDNLKRVAGRELSPSQQEMVNQIRQFVEQSKAAVSAGDLARGHNLALKAHLLSDELVKP
jgi:hypothetical protein